MNLMNLKDFLTSYPHDNNMIIRKAYKFKLKTTPEIEEQFSRFAECCRFVWNKVLLLNLDRLRNKQSVLRYYEACFWLTRWRNSEEYGFLMECSHDALQQKLKDLDKAFQDAFDKNQPSKRLPRIKKKGAHDAFRYPKRFRIDNRRIYIPKIGLIGFFKSQEVIGKPKNITVSRGGKDWFVSIQVEQEQEITQHPNPEKIIGLHLGIQPFLATTENDVIESPSPYAKHQKKLAKLQKKLSKKKDSSQNSKKLLSKISVLHQKIASIRNDFLHKTSTNLSKNNAIICVPTLEIQRMSKSAKGTLENPGKNVKIKSTMNRAILDQGLGEFARQLNYKLAWQGGELIKVDPHYTRLTCSHCQHVAEKQGPPTAWEKFTCLKCGFEKTAALNAAINIKAAGQVVLACGEKA